MPECFISLSGVISLRWMRYMPLTTAWPVPNLSTGIFRCFDHVPHSSQELIGHCSVNHPVIEAQSEHADLPNRNRVVNDNRALLDHPHTQYRHLRLVDDRRASPAAKRAGVGDSEGSPLHFIGFELFRARSLAEIV